MEVSPFILFTLIVISALLALIALKLVRLPTLPAYFIVGLFVGPNGLGILHSGETAHFLGEIGIVLLLFTIGLKFNIGALRSIRRFALVLGGAQVTFTMLAFAIPAWFFVGDILLATLIGFVAAVSSTAIVSQILLENNSVASPVGRRSIAVLLLQDLIVIPLIIIYSNKGGEHSLLITSLLLLVKIAVVLVLVLRVMPKYMRIWLNWSSRYGDKELFIINIVAIIALFSMLTGYFGLSYVLGAFLAGILISETFHRHRAEQIIEPFRQLFLGFFFVTLGILIDPTLLIENGGTILALTAILLAIKFPVIYACTLLVNTHRVTAFRTAFLLGGTGEFGFVLLSVAQQSDVLSNDLFQLLVPVNMLAMIFMPLFWRQSESIVHKLFPEDWQHNAERLRKSLIKTHDLNNHIIISGFGRTGQAVAGLLRTIGARDFIVIEEDYVIMEAVGNAEQITYGSSDRSDSLIAAGAARARALIVTFREPIGAALTVQNARAVNPNLYIIAKASTASQAKELAHAGANEVLIEAHESGFSLAHRCLNQIKSQALWLLPHALDNARSGKNPLFAGQYTGSANDEDRTRNLHGHHVTCEDQTISPKSLPEGVEIVVWRRDGQELDIQRLDEKFHYGDQIVLLGDEKPLEDAVKLLSA